ncbi:MAG: M15 family metallopeptidase [Clostridiales bacterium]|nr:M15 family metallopeptidase [Clostridiales bacterium]
MTAPKKQKRKKDPYKIFVRITIIIAAVALIGLAVFLVCNAWVDSEYRAIVEDIHQQNIADEQAFNMELDALRESASQSVSTDEDVVVTLPSWEATLEDTAWRIEDEGGAGLENTYTVTISSSTLCEGGLMLVNGWHSVPDHFDSANMISIGNASGWSIPVQDSTVMIFPNAYSALKAMYDDATAAGMSDYIVREGFRTNKTQTELFTDVMDKLSDKYSGNILIEQTKKTVNYPGTSEYQTGLSFRLGLYNAEDPNVAKQNFQESEQGIWVTDNSWKYGIIFRFPSDDFPTPQWEDKSYKTGVSIHLNLYRYVGKPHAVAMQILGYCLEEYVEFLMDHPHITIYENDVLRYEIVRISVNKQTAYDLPITSLSSEYLASIDNMGAVVMAYTYGF